jgi:CheY-like chemotaxis protein
MQNLQQRERLEGEPSALMRVLVADDDHDGADTLAALLQVELGCEVRTAYDGAAALREAIADPPDVLILDIRMPHLGGLDVVRRFEHAADNGQTPAGRRPLILAMTGGEVAHALADIDGCFDRAFAKPVDIEQLVQALRDHWHGAAPAAVRYELSDLFTRAAREAMPLLTARGQQLSFDYRGPLLIAQGDAVGVHTGLYRVLTGLVDVLGAGFLIFKGAVQPDPSGAWTFVVQAAGTGEPVPPERVGEVLTRLGLLDEPVEAGGVADGARKAAGICPTSGARVTYMSVPSEGMLFRFELPVRPVEMLEDDADAGGARAWIVSDESVGAALLARRLQRLGWRVRSFAGCEPARERLRQLEDDEAPDLLIGMEGSGVDTAGWYALNAALPPAAQRLLVVVAGSPALRSADAAGGHAAAIEPLSPAELIGLTRQVAGHDVGHDAPGTVAAALRDRPRVLVVDDIEINRIVAGGLIRALGYEVTTVGDGLDAIELCKAAPPDAVLMDVNMPVLNGLDATRRIRELQRAGRIAPFPIVAATADNDPRNVALCREVGMDGFLCKPLNLQTLKEELRRVTLYAPA